MASVYAKEAVPKHWSTRMLSVTSYTSYSLRIQQAIFFFFCFILVLDTAGHHFYFLRKFERSEPFLKLCKSHYANQVGQLAPTGNCLGTGPTSNVPAIVVRSPTQQTGICQSGRAQILCRGWFLSKEGFPLSKKCESVRKNL